MKMFTKTPVAIGLGLLAAVLIGAVPSADPSALAMVDNASDSAAEGITAAQPLRTFEGDERIEWVQGNLRANAKFSPYERPFGVCCLRSSSWKAIPLVLA